MPFDPVDLLDGSNNLANIETPALPGGSWTPILTHLCDFDSSAFLKVSFNLIQNPNITSSHLFRADILYDSLEHLSPNLRTVRDEDERGFAKPLPLGGSGVFDLKRTLVRKLVPRNPQLDRPVLQTCYYLAVEGNEGREDNLIVYKPHVDRVEDLPWYHPAVKSLAFLHSSRAQVDASAEKDGQTQQCQRQITLYFCLFSEEDLPLAPRLIRTARNLLSTIYKHGQGTLTGYTKKVHHDQLVSQQRVQDQYTELKLRHAKRLCSAWVEQTEPSKHVFEDIGIAAFLIELWKDMYAAPGTSAPSTLPPFPGFVDIGCGNGVLTEILLLSGYKGQGFDARRRKTWSVLSPIAQSCLKEKLFVPQPLFDLYPAQSDRPKFLSRARALLGLPTASELEPPTKPWHNGLFPSNVFIVSNHSDELTPWTPLLAYLTDSPFLVIPCCSHNLSGDRFRAPSAYNSHTADTFAPTYFAGNKSNVKSKSVAISIPSMEYSDDGTAADPVFAPTRQEDTSADHPSQKGMNIERKLDDTNDSNDAINKPETGDLKILSQRSRSKQPSAYASLCDWVTHLSEEVGFEVEKEMLRIPSTRNVGLVGRKLRPEFKKHHMEERAARVNSILKREGVDGRAWVRRCEAVLAKSGGKGHG